MATSCRLVLGTLTLLSTRSCEWRARWESKARQPRCRQSLAKAHNGLVAESAAEAGVFVHAHQNREKIAL